MTGEDEIGTLVVVVLKAKDLLDKHTFYKQDVFAKVTLNGVTKQTKVDIKGGQSPLWDEELRFPIMKNTATKFREMEVSCWAKEHKEDDLVGMGKLDINETLRTGEFDDWVKLSTDTGFRGEMYLEMTFFSAAPKPKNNLAIPKNSVALDRRPSKLSPADRLWRPPQPTTPHKKIPPLSSPPQSQNCLKTPPKGRDDALPPLPAQLPTSLMPGPGPRPKPQLQPQPVPLLAETNHSEPLPAILLPGGGNHHVRHASASPPRTQPQHYNRTASGSPSVMPGYYSPPSGSPPQENTPSVYGYSPHNGGVNRYERQRVTSTYGSYASSASAPAQTSYLPNGSPQTPSNALYSGSLEPIRPPTAAPTSYSSYNSTANHAPLSYSSQHDPNPAPSYNNIQPTSYQPPSVSNNSKPLAASSYTLPPAGFAFPMPDVQILPETYNLNPNPNSFYGPDHPHYTSPPQQKSELPDPYLELRYSTPLPLPSGSEERQQAALLRQQESLPPVPTKVSEEDSRVRELRLAEEAATRRKEQEIRDRELARELDRELNL